MPRFFPFLIAFIIVGIVILVAIFVRTGPTENQTRSPDTPTREQNQLPR